MELGPATEQELEEQQFGPGRVEAGSVRLHHGATERLTWQG
jgi:hypothetical protein